MEKKLFGSVEIMMPQSENQTTWTPNYPDPRRLFVQCREKKRPERVESLGIGREEKNGCWERWRAAAPVTIGALKDFYAPEVFINWGIRFS